LYNPNLPIKKERPKRGKFQFTYEPQIPKSCKESYTLVEKNYGNILFINDNRLGGLFYEADQKGISRLKVLEEINQEKKYPEMKIDDVGVGLGIIDKYEFYYNKNIQK
jgi:hypothetical protein